MATTDLAATEDFTTIRASKAVIGALKKMSVMADKSSINAFLENLIIDSHDQAELNKLSPVLAEKKKALTRKPRRQSM